MGGSSAVSSQPQGFVAGGRVGRYRIHERLARGGMGEVWLATALGPEGFAKKVVIKTILPAFAANGDYVRMLINEASIAARLNHPNIVQVFDLECHDGLYFITMEYLPGRTLQQIQKHLDDRGERLPPWVALTCIAACCDGLQYAHDYADDKGQPLGLLHRDLSPSNVMVGFTGGVSILDFGIAKATSRDGDNSGATLKGKYHFMAPERILGHPADRRSDVYSLGVVLYQLLAWRRPFDADNDVALLERIVRGKPTPPRRYAPWMSRALERCLLRALAADPKARYQQASELASDLRSCLHRSGLAGEPAQLAEFLRATFPRAPELARDGAAPAARAEAVPEPILELTTSAIEVLDEREDDLLLAEEPQIPIDVVVPPPSAPAPQSAEPIEWPSGSDQGERAPLEPTVYDLVVPIRVDSDRPTAFDLFAPAPAPAPAGDTDVFSSYQHPRATHPESEEDGERSWPWARSLAPTKRNDI